MTNAGLSNPYLIQCGEEHFEIDNSAFPHPSFTSNIQAGCRMSRPQRTEKTIIGGQLDRKSLSNFP